MPNPRTRNGRFPPLTISRAELLVGGRDRDFRAVVRDLVEFAARLQEIREALARGVGLAPPQYKIVMALAQREGQAATVSEMAEELRVTVPFVVTETRRLVSAGLLRKQADTDDRRRVNLTLTGQGRAIVRWLAPLQRSVNDVLFANLTARDLKALGKLARNLLDGCDAGLAIAKASPKPERKRAAKRPRRAAMTES